MITGTKYPAIRSASRAIGAFPVAELKVGNTFLVQAGQSIPVDGIVLAGETITTAR